MLNLEMEKSIVKSIKNKDVSNLASNHKALQFIESMPNAEALRQNLKDLYPEFNINNLKKIALLGAAEEGARFAETCQEMGIEVVLICDDNKNRCGQTIAGKIVSPSQVLAELDRNTPVIIATHRVLKPFLKLQEMGFLFVAPLALLQVTYPDSFTPHMFYDGWLEDLYNNKKRYREVAQLFNDEKSREILNTLLWFRLTLNPSVLIPIIEWELYGPNALLQYSDQETYIDGGTFDGDTIRLFIDRVNGKFNKIYGFEPDTNTFQKLKENFKHEPRVFPINKGLFSHSTILRFDNAGTRGSILTENNKSGIEVPVTSIDEILNGELVTYIKMNIEGAEIPALKGAKNAITKWKPKLAISVYHRPSDLWEIPFLVRSLEKDYSLYLRQHDGGVIESVLYALPK